jgi:hypothetical protein
LARFTIAFEAADFAVIHKVGLASAPGGTGQAVFQVIDSKDYYFLESCLNCEILDLT